MIWLFMNSTPFAMLDATPIELNILLVVTHMTANADGLFCLATRCGDHNVVIDTGFTEPVATRRGREFLHCPIDILAALGVAADAVKDVILTHLHYDHSGHFDRFANASFHLQEKELQLATGKYMHPRMSYSFEVDDVCGIVQMNYNNV